MENRNDLEIDNDGDLLIVNGDFVVSKSDESHISDIVNSHKGEYKQWPLIGFGISKYLKGTDISKYKFLRDLKEQLNYDNYQDVEINIEKETNKLTIEIK